MTPLEIILTPIYIFLLHLYFRSRRKKIADSQLRKYHRLAFWLKMGGCLLFVVYYTYLTGGDSRSLYFPEGKNLFQLLLKDGENWKYFFGRGADFNENLVSDKWNFGYYSSEGNFMIIRLVAWFAFFTFGQYTPISLLFAAYAFSGLWKLFLFFYERKPEMKKAFAISILFFPSIVFWSSGLAKDSICMGALGWLTYSVGNLTSLRQLFKNALMIALSVYLIAVIKVYILLAYAPIMLLYLFLNKLRAIKIAFLKVVVTSVVVLGVISVFSMTYSSYEEEMGRFSVDVLASTVSQYNSVFASMAGREDVESNFELGAEFDGTIGGFFTIAPYAIVATFYRPFIWETRKISQFLAAAESLVLIFFTLKLLLSAGPLRFFRYIFSDPMVLFCLLFALVFGLFVGTTTLNFGTLVRYKIPCMPFYTIGLFLIYEKSRQARLSRSPADILTGQPALA